MSKKTPIHELKIDTEYFREIANGNKLFEIRYNDRGYQKGDIVHLMPCRGSSFVEPYEGLKFVITYVTGFQQKENWVVFGIKDVKDE